MIFILMFMDKILLQNEIETKLSKMDLRIGYYLLH